MTATNLPRRLPLPILIAPAAPTVLVLLFHALHVLGFLTWRPDNATIAFTWAMATLPFVLAAVGLRRMDERWRPGPGPDLPQTLEAIRAAEAVANRAGLALAEAERRLLQSSTPPTDRPAPTTSHIGRWTFGLAIALVLGGAGGLAYALADDTQPPQEVHHHATFAVFVQGQRVGYSADVFDLAQRQHVRGHLHTPDQDLLHIEGKPGLTLGEFFERTLLAELTDDSLRLDDIMHDGRHFQPHDNQTLRLFVNNARTDVWIPVPHLRDYQPRDGDRILLTFGDAQGDELARQLGAVSNRLPP